MRDDVPRPPMERTAALANAPATEGAFLRVAVVLDEGR
ncbi:MAG: aspartyl/glutamyl-tRNA amidotransferase subunit C [Chloroflexota bacterium]|nr:aspartyl/glutamyl-tRNA amidotransferase subunit C [Chloroflexota bacterium]